MAVALTILPSYCGQYPLHDVASLFTDGRRVEAKHAVPRGKQTDRGGSGHAAPVASNKVFVGGTVRAPL